MNERAPSPERGEATEGSPTGSGFRAAGGTVLFAVGIVAGAVAGPTSCGAGATAGAAGARAGVELRCCASTGAAHSKTARLPLHNRHAPNGIFMTFASPTNPLNCPTFHTKSHERCCLSRSSITAVRRIAPLTTYCQKGSISFKFIAFCTTPMMKTPAMT